MPKKNPYKGPPKKNPPYPVNPRLPGNAGKSSSSAGSPAIAWLAYSLVGIPIAGFITIVGALLHGHGVI